MKTDKASSTAGARPGLDIRTYAMVGTLVVLWVVFEALTSGTYLSARNVSLLVRQMAFVAMLTSGVTLILVNGQVDLSLGSLAGLASGIVAILIVNLGLGIVVAIVLTLCIAALLGAAQGFCVARLRIPGFIVTLGGLMAFRGILFGITKSRTIAPFPPSFKEIGQGYVAPEWGLAIAIAVTGIIVFFQIVDRRQRRSYGFELAQAPAFVLKQVATALGIVGATLYMNLYQGLPIPILIVAVFAGFLTVLSRKTKFGRRVYASGGNQEAARLSGINVEGVTILLFVISAVYAASGGILLASRLNAGTPSAGTGAELDAIAAAVIGGTSLMGGIGSIPGALIGALVMASLDNGMSLLNVDVFYQMIIKGVILVAAVGFDINARR